MAPITKVLPASLSRLHSGFGNAKPAALSVQPGRNMEPRNSRKGVEKAGRKSIKISRPCSMSGIEMEHDEALMNTMDQMDSSVDTWNSARTSTNDVDIAMELEELNLENKRASQLDVTSLLNRNQNPVFIMADNQRMVPDSLNAFEDFYGNAGIGVAIWTDTHFKNPMIQNAQTSSAPIENTVQMMETINSCNQDSIDLHNEPKEINLRGYSFQYLGCSKKEYLAYKNSTFQTPEYIDILRQAHLAKYGEDSPGGISPTWPGKGEAPMFSFEGNSGLEADITTNF